MSQTKNPTDPIIQDKNSIFFRCVDDCHEPIMITNKQSKLIYVNKAWMKTYGYSLDEIQNKTPRLLRSKYQDDHFYSKMWEKILDPKIGKWRGELINLAKDGTEVPVLLNITPYLSNNGDILGYMGLALDLRQKKEMEAQLAQQDRLATIGELTSGLAHEIGTPIGVIRGRTEMLQMQLEKESPLQKSLDIIIRQTDRISSLISTLLRLSRKKSSEAMTNINLYNVINEVEELLIQRLRKFNIQFKNLVDKETFALGDRNKLEQIFINLLVNSIQAIETQIEKSHGDKREIQISAEVTSSHTLLFIKDTGGGIPDTYIGKIFHPFFTTKPTSKGTGLGLAIVVRLMEEMQGTISVQSKTDEGTQFTLSLKLPQ